MGQRDRAKNSRYIAALVMACTSCGPTSSRLDALVTRAVDRPVTFNRAIYDGNLWNSYYLYREAVQHFDELRYDEAIAKFKDHVYRYPDSPLRLTVHLKLGYAYLALRRYPEAADYFSRYIKESRKPYEDVEHVFATVRAYEAAGLHQEALFYLSYLDNKARLTSQEEARFDLYRGFIFYGLGRREDAEESILRSIDYIDTYRRYLPGIEVDDIAKSYMTLGKVAKDRLLLIDVVYEKQDLANFLKKKLPHLEQAEAQFSKAIGQGSTKIALESLMLIADSYYGLYALLAQSTKLPKDLPLQAIKTEQLRIASTIGRLLERSCQIYAQGATFAKDLREEAQWTASFERRHSECTAELRAAPSHVGKTIP